MDSYQKVFIEQKIELNDLQIKELKIYAELLKQWNQKINLTAVDDDEGILFRHFVDSLVVLKYINISSNDKIIDIGTGAGFPGLPLAIVTSADTVLFDALNKRISFLKAVIADLDIQNVNVLHARAEELARQDEYREKINFAFSRAVTSLNVLIELAIPFLEVGGSLIAYKSEGVEAEIAEAKKALIELNAKVDTVYNYTDYYGKSRCLVKIDKLGITPDRYPRRNGVPNKKPL